MTANIIARTQDEVLDALIRARTVTPEQVEAAVLAQARTPDPLPVTYFLVEAGSLSPSALLAALASLHAGIRTVDLSVTEPAADALQQLGPDHVRRLRALPIARAGQTLQVALADPYPLAVIEELERLIHGPAQPILADEHSLRRAIDRHCPASASIREISSDGHLGDDVDALDDSMDAATSQALVPRAVTEILADGVRMGASDIHIEFYGARGRVRYRVDGAMAERPEQLENSYQRRLVGRLKYMAGMDQAQDRVPDNGSITTTIDGRRVQFRVSTLPTIYGEKVVLRILENTEMALALEQLGLAPDALAVLRAAAGRRDRMLLVTGPTGSGKSTLLYSLLRELNRPDRNVVTIEDPVERRLPGINQVNIQGRGEEGDRTRLTFAGVLNDVLRQDPDLIMVGEIRDRATAETATRAAITGHGVFSTLHTTDTVATIARLRGLGIPDYAIVDTVELIVAQRLVRKVCSQCAEAAQAPSESALIDAGFDPVEARTVGFRRGRGCPRCNQSAPGYAGRTAVHELLRMSPPLRQAIMEGKSPDALRAVARAEGLITLRARALHLAATGITTFEEAVHETPAAE
jgi:type IV pilus assembly protein PilB